MRFPYQTQEVDRICVGAVSLVAKVSEPSTAKDGRPRTILLPGKTFTDAAWELASNIEEALTEQSDLFGVSL